MAGPFFRQSSPKRVADFLLMHLGTRDREVFAVILLDASMRFIDYVELFHGTIASVHVQIDVRVLNHFVVGEHVISMKAQGC